MIRKIFVVSHATFFFLCLKKSADEEKETEADEEKVTADEEKVETPEPCDTASVDAGWSGKRRLVLPLKVLLKLCRLIDLSGLIEYVALLLMVWILIDSGRLQ